MATALEAKQQIMDEAAWLLNWNSKSKKLCSHRSDDHSFAAFFLYQAYILLSNNSRAMTIFSQVWFVQMLLTQTVCNE